MGMRATHKPEKNEPMERVEPGRYHVQVISIVDDLSDPDKAFTKAILQVKQGTNADMVNRVHHERLNWYHSNDYVQERNQNQIFQLAVECGITTWKELQAQQANGKEIELDWSLADGAQVIVEIEHRADKNDATKIYSNIKPGCIWSVEDPAVNDVPKDEAALSAAAAADKF